MLSSHVQAPSIGGGGGGGRGGSGAGGRGQGARLRECTVLASPGAAHRGVGRAAGGGGDARGGRSLLDDVLGVCMWAGRFFEIVGEQLLTVPNKSVSLSDSLSLFLSVCAGGRPGPPVRKVPNKTTSFLSLSVCLRISQAASDSEHVRGRRPKPPRRKVPNKTLSRSLSSRISQLARAFAPPL